MSSGTGEMVPEPAAVGLGPATKTQTFPYCAHGAFSQNMGAMLSFGTRCLQEKKIPARLNYKDTI